MNGGQGAVLIVVLLILVGLAAAFYLVYARRLKACKGDQGIYCLNLSCPYGQAIAPNSQNNGCGNYPYRKDSAGEYVCAMGGVEVARSK